MIRNSIIPVLANRLAQDEVPAILRDKRILELDLPKLCGESSDTAELHRRLRAVINETEALRKTILLMDDFSVFTTSPGTSSIVKTALSNNDLRIIGTVTCLEAARQIEYNPYLSRYFQSVLIPLATKDECRRILSEVRTQYESFHALVYTDDALEAAMEFAARGDSDRLSLLEKSIWLLDEAGAKVKMSVGVPPDDLLELQVRIKDLARRVDSAITSHDFETAHYCSEEEKKEREKMRVFEEKLRTDVSAGSVERKDIEEGWASANWTSRRPGECTIPSEPRGEEL